MNKALFLDRDGVINKLIIREGKAQAPYTLEEFELFPGVLEACLQFKKNGYLLVVVTNQPDVARGWVNKESVEMINQKVRELLPVDEIKICYHTNSDQCACRKPMPGMLLEAASELSIDMQKSFMVGDRYSDMAAGVSAGCSTILVGAGDTQGSYPTPNFQVDSLFECLEKIFSFSADH